MAVTGHGRAHVERGKSAAAPRVQLDRLPQAGRAGARAPVPAERAGHLAQLVVGLGVFGRTGQRVADLGLLADLGGGRELDRELDGLCSAQILGYVEAVGAEHVRRQQPLDAVDSDCGDGVDAAEHGCGGCAFSASGREDRRADIASGRASGPLLVALAALDGEVVDVPAVDECGWALTGTATGKGAEVAQARRLTASSVQVGQCTDAACGSRARPDDQRVGRTIWCGLSSPCSRASSVSARVRPIFSTCWETVVIGGSWRPRPGCRRSRRPRRRRAPACRRHAGPGSHRWP